MAIRQRHFPFDDVLELLEHIFASGVSDIASIRHKAAKAAIPFTDVLPGGSFDKHHHLQCDFEQQKQGFDALGSVQIYGFYAAGPLGSAEGVLAFVLSLVGHHGRFDAQLIWALVGQQRVITAARKGLIKSVLIETQLHFKMILGNGHLRGFSLF